MWFERMPGWRSAVGAVSAVLSAFFLAGLLATSAWPRVHAGPNVLEGGHRLQGAIAPLDGGGSLGSPAAAYSLRRLKSTYTGPGVRLRRASDNAEQDINFLGFTGFTGAPLNTAAAQAHCAATSCFVSKWYDQSGNGRDVAQAAQYHPPYQANCIGTLPCIKSTAVTGLVTGANVPVVAPLSFNVVANYASGTGQCNWPFLGNNTWGNWAGNANTWLFFDAVTYIATTVADNAWHAAVGVMAGASSVVRVDGAETTGNIAGSAVAAPLNAFLGAAASTCSTTEVVYWSGYALTANERAALTANQRNFWGF